mmetsp:Transcript_62655/g.110592  ORF Transcript_62655/g.110592 Transcript_62655/m.110592 type:complete len:243 (+) Transcript_62655:1223-1951(+)
MPSATRWYWAAMGPLRKKKARRLWSKLSLMNFLSLTFLLKSKKLLKITMCRSRKPCQKSPPMPSLNRQKKRKFTVWPLTSKRTITTMITRSAPRTIQPKPWWTRPGTSKNGKCVGILPLCRSPSRRSVRSTSCSKMPCTPSTKPNTSAPRMCWRGSCLSCRSFLRTIPSTPMWLACRPPSRPSKQEFSSRRRSTLMQRKSSTTPCSTALKCSAKHTISAWSCITSSVSGTVHRQSMTLQRST